MKTYLDDKKFRKLLKIHCIEENIQSFYLKSVIANIFSFIRKPVEESVWTRDNTDSVIFGLPRCGFRIGSKFMFHTNISSDCVDICTSFEI